MYSWLKKFYVYFRLLSFDLVVGVVAGFIFSSYFLKNKPEFYHWAILPLSVWIIYIFDHVLDGLKLRDKSVLKRHRFFFRNRKIFIAVLIIASLGNGFLVYTYLDTILKISGGILGFFVLVYMFFNHIFTEKREFYFFKEFVIAGLYCAGIWIIPMSLQGFLLHTDTVLFFILHFLIVSQNVLLYSYFEFDTDTVLNKKTLPYFIGKNWTRTLIFLLGTIGLCFSLLLVILFPGKIIFITILTLIQIIFIFITVFTGHFGQNERYGIWADASFFLMMLAATL
jgi:4-hydroxybenzoate polyprenyltransferase